LKKKPKLTATSTSQMTTNYRQWIFDWVPTCLILGGLALNWIGLDNRAWVMYFGFASYGILGVIDLLNNKTGQKNLLKILKIIALLLILIISLLSILDNPTYFMSLFALVLLDRIILTRSRVESN
jgi:uncharacterized membrane protein HdeD (DUF308 family)